MWYDSKIICTTQKAEFCQIRSNDEEIPRLGRVKVIIAFTVRPVLNQTCPFNMLAPCFNPITSIWILYSHLHLCFWSSQSFAFKEFWLKSVTNLASPMGAIYIPVIWFVFIWMQPIFYCLLVRWSTCYGWNFWFVDVVISGTVQRKFSRRQKFVHSEMTFTNFLYNMSLLEKEF